MNTVRNEGLIKKPKSIGKRFSNQKESQTSYTILNGVCLTHSAFTENSKLQVASALEELLTKVEDGNEDDESEETPEGQV
jgi:hypothetical protein